MKEKSHYIKYLKKVVNDGNTPIKLFFLGLSIFLWFLIKLSQEGYDATVEFPVEYINTPSNKIFKSTPPKRIAVNLTTGGFNLLKYSFTKFRSLKVDVAQLERTTAKGTKSFWHTNSNLNFIESQLGMDVQVHAINPDTIFFDFNRLISKKVPVQLDIKKEYSNLINIYGAPKIIPDSITITGSEADLTNIKHIKTKKIVLDGKEENFEAEIALNLPDTDGFSFSEEEVDVQIIFTKMTQGNFSVPIEVLHIPEGYEVKIFPKDVEVKFHTAVKDFSRASSADFRVIANFDDILNNIDARYINLKMEAYPSFVSAISYEPKKIEFIISKK